MRKALYLSALFVAMFLAIGTGYQTSESYCVIFPQGGRDIFGVAQRNIIIFEQDRVSLIPQVHFEGDAKDFGILVPVPAKPELSPVGGNIFTEASFMTQPLVRDANQGCGCSGNDEFFGPNVLASTDQAGAVLENSKSGVTIIHEQIVGTFQAVVLQATSAGVLAEWLNENQYSYNPADSAVLSEYVQKEWFFVAMKLDTNQAPPFIDQWWNATTSPAKISFAYAGEDLIYPLKISAISTKEKVEVLVYTIGKDPIRFEGAKVEYANEVDDAELALIANRYPTMYDFITAGSFVTKLRRTFRKSEMQNDMSLFSVDDRREFREIIYTNQAGLQFLGMLLLVFLIAKRRKFWR